MTQQKTHARGVRRVGDLRGGGPPGPIPNPVVTQRSAGEYWGGDPLGGEAAAGTPHPQHQTAEDGPRLNASATHTPVAGWSSGSSLGS